MKYVKELDTLRAFAVIFVLLGHWGLPFDPGPVVSAWIKGIIPEGSFGVDLFFVLSGFLITGILLEAKKGDESRVVIMKNFIIRRTLRIFPIYYLTILILVLMGNPFVKEYFVWFVSYTSNILCYKQASWNTFSHTWSLSVEEQFYILWPWLIIFIPSRYLKQVFFGSILVGIGLSFYVGEVQHPGNPFTLLLMPACMQAFGIGGLYAYVRYDRKNSLIKVINVLFPLAVLIHFYWAFDIGANFIYLERTVNSVMAIWIIHKALTVKKGWFKIVLQNRVLVKIGRISYGIYLYHYVITNLYLRAVGRLGAGPVKDILSGEVVSYILQLTILAVLCLLSYHFIERPILGLKKHFEYRKRAQLIPVHK